MTDKTHPITPPPELVREWVETCLPYEAPADNIAAKAARWGADQELEACCEWFKGKGYHPEVYRDLRAARRPKPPSLKEQSLALIDKIQGNEDPWDIRDLDVVRRALEELDD